MLDAHLDEFKENLGTYSKEHGKRFHQDIKDFESRYQRQYNENMVGDYIWGLIRESDLEYRQKKPESNRLLTKLCTVFHTRTMVCATWIF